MIRLKHRSVIRSSRLTEGELTALTVLVGIATIFAVLTSTRPPWPFAPFLDLSSLAPFATVLLLTHLTLRLEQIYPVHPGTRMVRRRMARQMLPSAYFLAVFSLFSGQVFEALICTLALDTVCWFYQWPCKRKPPGVKSAALSLSLLAAALFVMPWILGSPPMFDVAFGWLLCLMYVAVVATRTTFRATLQLAAIAGMLVAVATTMSLFIIHPQPTLSISAVSFLGILAPAAAGGMIVFACLVYGCLEAGMRINPSLQCIPFGERELGRLAKAATRPLAIRLAREEAYFVRESGRSFRQAELDRDKSLPLLINALHDPDLDMRYSAVQVLAEMGPEATVAVSDLVKMVGADPLPGDRAAEALARIGASGVATLVELLAAGGEPQRIAAAAGLRLADQVASLGELGAAAASAQEAIRARLEDSDLLVRLAARKALMRLSAAEVVS